MMLIYLNGLLLGLSLIMALGPQNIFLIRQGALRKHAALSALTCFICDITLVTSSVIGLHHVLEVHPHLTHWLTNLGAAFLCYYGIRTLLKSLSNAKTKKPIIEQNLTRLQIIMLALGFSLLNPHAIIDSLVLIGGGSAQYPGHQQAFLFGVITSSLIWFSTLTLTTYYFSSVLNREHVWKRVEFFSGLLMIYLCINLLFK